MSENEGLHKLKVNHAFETVNINTIYDTIYQKTKTRIMCGTFKMKRMNWGVLASVLIIEAKLIIVSIYYWVSVVK